MAAEYYGIKTLKRFDAFMFRFAIRLCWSRVKMLRARIIENPQCLEFKVRFLEVTQILNEYLDEYEREFT
ncbi:MAG: hypothetical protein DRQ39_03500 [Gammaproteobacteria bacterium]|nr:MAG: hypothetical protein DRQ39_03500 [Gammaproteobacteria bacterium]